MIARWKPQKRQMFGARAKYESYSRRARLSRKTDLILIQSLRYFNGIYFRRKEIYVEKDILKL